MVHKMVGCGLYIIYVINIYIYIYKYICIDKFQIF